MVLACIKNLWLPALSIWIADLLQHGLLQAGYIPDRDQRELRELVSYRKSLVQDRTRELNRLQKMLEGSNIKLSGTAANINGKSARSIIDTILSGAVIDSSKYDEMCANQEIANNLRAPKVQIIEDLNGFMSPLQRKMMKEFLKHVDELDAHHHGQGFVLAIMKVRKNAGAGKPGRGITCCGQR